MKKNMLLITVKKLSLPRLICLFLLFTNPFSFLVKGQSPGGVSGNLTSWFKANTTVPGNITTSTGNSIATWKSDFGTYSVSQASQVYQPVFEPAPSSISNFNFNPVIQFDGATGTSLFNSATSPNLLGNNGTVFIISNARAGVTNPNGNALTYYSNSNFRYQIKPGFRLQVGTNSQGWTCDVNGIGAVPASAPLESSYILVSKAMGANFRARKNADSIPLNNTGVSTYFPAILGGLHIGSQANGGTSGGAFPFNGAISEVISFDVSLSATDINKVESYLAVKYGVTLSQNSAYGPAYSNYTASNGTQIWDATANSAYANNITGIGRDDVSVLNQKQSKSVHNNALLYLYNGNTGGSFPAMNTDNVSTFSSDLSYLIIGDNGSSTAFSGCTSGNQVSRMGRIWKAQKTGNGVDLLTIAVNIADISTDIKKLLVSQDPTFPSSATTFYNLSTGTDKLYAAVTLNNNDYFTFGSDSLQVTLTPTSTDCSNQNTGQITSATTGGTQPYTYSWSPSGQTTAALTAVASGTYTLTVTQGGCQYSQDATIAFNNNLSLVTNTSSTICTGGSVNVNTTSNATGYNWSPATGVSDPSIPNPVLSASNTTTYTVTATLGTCTTSQSFTITVIPPVTVNAGSDVNVTAGQSVQLQGNGPQGTYLWTPSTGLSNPGILNPVASPAATTAYTLTITTIEGCVGSNDVNVNVDVSIPDCVKPMNALTPNGDGINDKWLVTYGCPNTAKVAVFNRYGSKVYESGNYQNDWQGTYKGKNLPDGTYYFIIEFTMNNGRRPVVKGNLTILR